MELKGNLSIDDFLDKYLDIFIDNILADEENN